MVPRTGGWALAFQTSGRELFLFILKASLMRERQIVPRTLTVGEHKLLQLQRAGLLITPASASLVLGL